MREINRSGESETENLRLSESEGNIRYSLANEGESTSGITLEDVNALRSIGRKSINAFTSEEIRATEPWARKFYRELGTKSPFFRAWFGDWRENDTTPVTLPDIDENAQIASGKIVNQDTGVTISWSKGILRESTIHARREVRSYVELLVKNIKEVAEKAVFFDTVVSDTTSKSKMDGTAFLHSLYTIAPINGGNILIKLYAEEALSNKSSNTFTRAYELKYITEVAGIDNGVHSQTGSLTGSHPATDLSVADLFALVKRFDKDFAPKVASEVVNEDGTPKVMYLGTDSGDGEVGPKGEGGRYY